jgi:hypothetical protein
MNFFELYGKEIVALIVPFITWFLSSFLKGKARLNVSNPHKFTNIINTPLLDDNGNELQPNQYINTSSYLVLNAGREKATDLEIVFNWKPFGLNVWPARKMTESTDSNSRHILTFDSLAPNEAIGFELVSINRELPGLITVRSNECTGNFVDMYPQPVTKDWIKKAALVLMLAGMGMIVYISIILIQFLVLKTPLA